MNIFRASLLVICLSILCSLPTVGLAKVLSFTLKEMVKEAKWIIVGRVVEIVKTDIKDNAYGYEYEVTIEVEETLKGDPSEKRYKIRFLPELSTEPVFLDHERSIFFIKEWKNKKVIVQGYAGKVAINDDKVKLLSMRGEASEQELKVFIRKVKELSK